jgi:ergothioneine biosynthesis protein EgtB
LNVLDDPVRIRSADAELLSLALLDARNLTLRWLSVFEARQQDGSKIGGTAPRWWAGHAAWFQEYWIARHVQRQRGPRSDPGAVRLPSAERQADAWFALPPGAGALPDIATTRQFMAATMDITLDLLAGSPADDDALHFFRAALLHEDRIGERLAEMAAEMQLAPAPEPAPPWLPPPARPACEPVWLPATRAALGSSEGGFVPDNERGRHEVAVPEFEIDAQAVSWARYVEFAEDGGYDRRELWSEPGWAWVQEHGRRAPRDVEQLRGGVLLLRQGQTQRVPPTQPAVHVSRHEAMAWCRWAGRRLPTEPEWELAAVSASSRGFVWGDVFEWVAGSARPWPGCSTSPGSLDPMPAAGSQGVLRGASWLTPLRWRHPRARRFALPESDGMFCGFRSCAL